MQESTPATQPTPDPTAQQPPAAAWPRPWLVAVLVGLAVLGGAGWWGWRFYDAHRHLQAARAAAAQYHNDEAWQHLQVCLAYWPDDPAIRFLAARTARRLDKVPDAEQLLNEYDRLAGRTHEGAFERVLLRAQQGEPAALEYVYHQLQTAEPDRANRILLTEALARGYLSSLRFAQAIYFATQLVDLVPDNAQFLTMRGLIYDWMDDDEALADYRRAVELDPESPIRLKMADRLLQINRVNEARQHYEYVLSRQPDATTALLGLARCHLKAGELQAARPLLERVLPRIGPDDPFYPLALGERGRLALFANETHEAVEWLQKAVAADRTDPTNLYSLAQALQHEGRGPEAAAFEKQMKQVDTRLRRVAKLKAQVYENPRDPAPRHDIGVLLVEDGKDKRGLHWLMTALREEPTYKPTHKFLADYYAQLGQQDQAAIHRARAK